LTLHYNIAPLPATITVFLFVNGFAKGEATEEICNADPKNAEE